MGSAAGKLQETEQRNNYFGHVATKPRAIKVDFDF